MSRARSSRPLNVRVRDTVLDFSASDTTPKVYVRSGEKPLYKVRIFLEGEDLARVRKVTYRLHSTFPNPKRSIRRTPRNQICELVIWTWGVFTVRVEIDDRYGQRHSLTHQLGYAEELKRTDIEYVTT